MDTFVDSSWYFLRYCSPHDDTQAPSTSGRARVGAVRHLRRRRGARGAAPAVRALLHQGAARHGDGRLRRAVLGAAEPGPVINQGKKMSKSLGNGVDLGEQLAEFGVDAVRLTLVFAGPPEDDIDWADMSPGGSLRFLQRAWRLSGDVTSPAGVDRRRRRRRAAARDRAGGARGGRADGRLPLQRDGRPGDGAGERHPQGHRLGLRPGRPGGARGRRGGRDHAVAGGAVHRRGDVGPAGPRADGRPRRLARRSTRRCWSSRR